MNDKVTTRKLIKTVIKVVLIAGLLVGGIVFFILSADKMSPESLKAQEDAYRQSWGYEQRIQDIIDIRGLNESTSKSIIDILLEDVGLPEILSIEKSDSGIDVTTNYYTASVRLMGREVDTVKIGNALIYRRLEPDKNQIIVDKLYSFNEYDGIVERLGKSLKLEKQQSSDLFRALTNIDIHDFNNIKKVKSGDKLEKVYKGTNLSTPIKIILRNDILDKVYISGLTYKGLDDILVYDRNSKGDVNQSFKNYTISNHSRTFIPESLAFQIGQQIDATLRFPIAIASGDDSWVIVKLDEDTIYFESNADITRGGKTDNERIIGIRTSDSQYTYLKVGRKVIIE